MADTVEFVAGVVEGLVYVMPSRPVAWLKLPPEQARALAWRLLAHADEADGRSRTAPIQRKGIA